MLVLKTFLTDITPSVVSLFETVKGTLP